MLGYPDQPSDRLSTSDSALLTSPTCTGGTMTSQTTNWAEERREEKQREAEPDTPATERWGVQAYAALSSSLMTAQSVAASCFGAVAVDHIQQGRGTIAASDGQLTFFLTSHFIGMTLGALVAGGLGQRFGARTVMIATSPASLLAWVAIGLAPSITVMVSGRILLGCLTSVQMSSNVCFISATSGPKYRGLFCNFMEIMVAVAITITFLVGKYLMWRYSALALGIGLNVLVACLLVPLHADPLWLLSRGRLEEARRALLFYRGPGADTTVIKERAAAAAGQQCAASSTVEKLGSLRLRSGYLPVLLIAAQFIMNVWSGAGVIQNYAVVFIRRVGITMDPFSVAMVLAVSRIPATVLSSLLVDRWGRRPLLVISSLGMAVCHAVMAAYFLFPALAAHTWVPVVCLFGAMNCFSVGVGPVTWILLGELLPRSLRELCSGGLLAFYTLMTVAQLQTFPAMLAAFDEAGVFLLWAVVALVYVLFVLGLLPETRGLDIEQIEQLFESRPVLSLSRLLAGVSRQSVPPHKV